MEDKSRREASWDDVGRASEGKEKGAEQEVGLMEVYGDSCVECI